MGLASIITMLTQLAYRSYSHNPSSSTWSCSEASSAITFHCKDWMLASLWITHTPFIYPKLSDIKVDIQKLSSKQWIRAICFGRHHPRCGRGPTEDNEDLRQISPTALYTIFSTRLGACVSVHWWVGYQPTQLSWSSIESQDTTSIIYIYI